METTAVNISCFPHGDPAFFHRNLKQLIAGAREALYFSIFFFASRLQNRNGWRCIMHGTSCVALERTVGPGGPAAGRKKVSRFTLSSVEPRLVDVGRWREKIGLPLSSLLCSCVCGTDCFTLGFPVTPGRPGKRQHSSIFQSIFIETHL